MKSAPCNILSMRIYGALKEIVLNQVHIGIYLTENS